MTFAERWKLATAWLIPWLLGILMNFIVGLLGSSSMEPHASSWWGLIVMWGLAISVPSVGFVMLCTFLGGRHVRRFPVAFASLGIFLIPFPIAFFVGFRQMLGMLMFGLLFVPGAALAFYLFLRKVYL